jgi:hypothetical protein
VITANRVPDHATITRFVCRDERALAELFGSVLTLCARAGLVSTGVVAIDEHQAARRRQPRGEFRLRADRP